MGWFDRQIRERRVQDAKGMQKSYQKLASVVDIRFKNVSDTDQKDGCEDALMEICRYFHVEMPKLPEQITDINEQMDFAFRPVGVMRRRIKLDGAWWKDLSGPVLCEKKEGGTVALLPGLTGNYRFRDEDGNYVKINERTAKYFEREAVCFYRPLPQGKLMPLDLYHFMIQSFTKYDRAMLIIMGLAVTLIGMITPAATAMLFDAIVPSGRTMLLYTVAFMLAGTAVASYLFSILQSIFKSRIQQQMKSQLRSAVFMRVLGMPVAFFKDYSSGDMAQRVMALDQLTEIVCSILLETGVTALFSLTYIVQIFVIAPALTLPALAVFVLQLAVGILRIVLQTKVSSRQLKAQADLDGLVFALFSGIQKIKLAGCEKRAFSKWAGVYKEKAEAAYNPPLLLRAQMAFAPAVSILGMLFIYSAAADGVTMSQYVAFSSSYGMVSGAIASLMGAASYVALIKPILDLASPILEGEPEVQEEKETVGSLSGMIELNNVSFRYTPDGPWVIRDLDLRIGRGQYVAIVGTTGCGKSTLMRLMLGFENPEIGAIYYDGKDLKKLDQRSLRKNIGVVMQNGKLFAGDIFSNIAISAPQLTMKGAWEAAEMAGVAEDIRDMPMGMNTIISEGSGGISGGQRQRLMIARAIAHKPKILMLDEATSALDNITQKKVSDSLEEMKCTRIVIAHRLSTICQCDRIIVLDKGRIIEDGTYDELNAKGGFFTKLVERQQVTAHAAQ